MEIDPALAHLYGDVEADEADELAALKGATAETLSLEELVAFAETLDEELDDHDLEELSLLVSERVTSGTFTDADAAELGLGEIQTLEDGDVELVLNEVGRDVLRRIVARRVQS